MGKKKLNTGKERKKLITQKKKNDESYPWLPKNFFFLVMQGVREHLVRTYPWWTPQAGVEVRGVGVAHATPVLENYFFILTEVDWVLIGTQTTPFFTQTTKKNSNLNNKQFGSKPICTVPKKFLYLSPFITF